MDACTTFRDAWLESALDAHAGQSIVEHLADCEPCASWATRRQDQMVALIELRRHPAPDAMANHVAAGLVPGAVAADGESSPFEARLERRLATLERHVAPSVLDRLVAEELADPKAARTRRFAGDLDRPAVPGALTRRLKLVGEHHGRRPPLRGWALAAAAAAAALAIGLVLTRDSGPEGRSFTVHYGRPEAPNALGAALADGWTGGMLRAGIKEGGR